MSSRQKQIIGIALTLTMLFLVGCGNTSSTPVLEESAATSPPKVETEEPATDSPRVGDLAPDFRLPDSNGNLVTLSSELGEYQSVVLVFYHSHT
jgi:cytochrome oxidase Cu insertion factor (SCO1/SenC/PrrC family)